MPITIPFLIGLIIQLIVAGALVTKFKGEKKEQIKKEREDGKDKSRRTIRSNGRKDR